MAVSVSTKIGFLLGMCTLAYIFLPFYLSIKGFENYYQGNNTIVWWLGCTSLAFIFLPEKKIKAIINAFADNIKIKDDGKDE